MVRKYVAKRPRLDPKARMEAIVRLHGQGWSNRKIAAQISVSEGTVRNDLARWERERSNVAPLVRNPLRKSAPSGGDITHPDYAVPAATVTPIRRIS